MKKGEKKKYTPYLYNEYIFNDIKNLCQPLFQTFDLDFFGYMRLFSNGKYFAISTNLDWQKYFLENLDHHGDELQHQIEKIPYHKLSYFLWPEAPDNIQGNILLGLYNFNIWNGLTIYRKESDYIDSWSFAATKQKVYPSQFYINNLSYLHSFVNYFNQRAAPLLAFKDEDKLSKYPDFKLESSLETDMSLDEKEKLLKKFLESITLDHLHATHKGKEITLSKRELECLGHLSHGKSWKEIAMQLRISARTVETYINKIKEKANISYKSELISFYESIKDQVL